MSIWGYPERVKRGSMRGVYCRSIKPLLDTPDPLEDDPIPGPGPDRVSLENKCAKMHKPLQI